MSTPPFSAQMSIYRLFQAEKRLATAKTLQDGTLFQVYPRKKYYETLEQWRAEWSQCDILQEDTRKVTPRPKKPSRLLLGRNLQLMEFFEPEYMEMIRHLKIEATPEPTVHIEMPDGTTWEVTRPLDFMKAPHVWKNGVRFGEGFENKSYSPALTTAKWWLMLAFSTPEN